MLRFLNIVAVLLAGASAFFLYSMKYETRMLDKRTVELARKLKDERRSIVLRRAEWSHLSRPERLERLARKHLGLKPLEVHQISDFKHLKLPEWPDTKSRDESVTLLLSQTGRQSQLEGARTKRSK